MLDPRSQSMAAPGIGSIILQVRNNASLSPYFVVENKDSSLSAAIEYQESDDGNTWSTVVGTSKSIPPGQSDGQSVTSTKRLLALFAQGDVLLDVHVIRNYNGVVAVID